MANCSNCGAALREGAGFCSGCGQAVVKAVFCSKCGTELEAGDKFCFSCGAAVKGVAAPTEQPKRRGRPPKSEAAPAKKKASYPDICGFYGQNNKVVSVSERAIVFSESGYLYRVDKDLNMYKQRIHADSVAQTADGVWAADMDYNQESGVYELLLWTLSDELQVLSKRVICELPGCEETDYYRCKLSGESLYLIHHVLVEDDAGRQVSQDLRFTRFDLVSGEETILEPGEVCVDSGKLKKIDAWQPRLLADGSKLYFEGDIHFPDAEEDDDDEGAVFCLDFDSGEFSLLWHGNGNLGYPRFFDFKKGIMWTNPREMECKRRGWEPYGDLPLVARKITPNAPILANCHVWEKLPYGRNFTYFDGEKAYFAPDYYHFYAVDQMGNQSEDWNQSGHGRTETAVVWQDKVIMDLMADYWYTAYPAGFGKPDWRECIDMREKEIK